VSGEDDPVGNYGKGVREVARKLSAQGREVTCKLYAGARHEILNDFTYEAVREDILAFCRG
jgi:alpha-beta hydrolase superfamily lysophospholipase